MLKRILFIFLSSIFLILVIFPMAQDYYDFHNKKKQIEKKENILEEKLKNFSLEKIKFLKNTDFFYSLDKIENKNLVSKKIIEKINSAKKNIFIEVYLFTHKNIRNAIIQAKKRWVEIKIILEKNIYKSANLNMKTFLEFKKNWIDVTWSNPKNFKLNHSKIIIIDEQLILSSWNLTYSTFSKNTDFFIFTKDFNIVSKFKKIFISDFEGKKEFIYDHNIILSPYYTKEKFDYLFENCTKSLKIYIPSIWNWFLKKILDLQQKISTKGLKPLNKNIQIIFWDRESNLENIEKLRNAWISVKIQKNIHAKAFLIDEKILFIWSINFNTNSITKNREMWILLKNPEIIEKFLDKFSIKFE